MYDLVYYVFSKVKIYYIIILVNRMKKIDNKGFTLVELIATIVLLSLVMGIGAFSITQIINNAKDKDYKLLIENINNAVELYYQECKFVNDNCDTTITLGFLVNNGYLKGNSKITEGANKDKMTLVNPKTDENISGCSIKYEYKDGKIVISAITSENCPTTVEYAG